MSRRCWPALFAAIAVPHALTAQAPSAASLARSLDAVIQAGMHDWEIPGLSVAVVRNDSVLLQRGYGVRELGRPGRVDEHTLFGIMSTTKAMTAAAIAMLVDDGVLQWDDPVTRWLPEFQMPATAQTAAPSHAAWRDGAVCYEVFVRSFADSDGDGIGDLEGLIGRLDYINDGDPATMSDLGATCMWLMPIAESPSYHGYDVTEYYRVDPEYGTNADFRRLTDEAHRRGVRVLVDMVVNHVSSEHPYFQDALRNPHSPYRDWFRWSETIRGRNEWGDVNWHPVPGRDEYYYGFFSRVMPDLNWETVAVREEMKRVADFWLGEMGADGFRLDAVRHLMEEGNRTTNVPRTHDMLREYAAYVRGAHPDAFTIGEVWDGGEALLAYYPDQLDAYFAFGVSDAILEAVRAGSSARLFAPVLALQEAVPAARWAPFLRNHDQTRTMTVLGGDVERAKLAATLLLTLPGLPFVYYGEEIGMTGDKPDPRIRTPMHWSLDPAAGFTEGVPWEPLQPDSFTANVEDQDADPESLLNHYRRLIHLHASNAALGMGDLVPLDAGTDQVAAYLRRRQEHVALVVVNLGDTPLSNVTLRSDLRAVPSGRYVPRSLLGGEPAAPLDIRRDGGIRGYVPLRVLAARTAYVFDVKGER